MAPVYQDKFAMLMHPKRQETETASNSNVSTPAAPTSTRPTTTSAPPTTTTTPTSTTPTSTSQPPTSSATPTSTSETTSSVVTSTSSIPTSTSVVSTSSVPSTTPVSTTAPTTTARSTAPTTTAAPTSVSRTTLNIPPTVIRTTSDGQIFTVTAVVGSTESANAQGSAKKPFFQNTGAVVGVFVVVGIVAMVLAVMLVTMFIRKRRAKQFDREVQEAAREAAHAQAPIDDDDDYAGAQSYNTHGSQPMSTERPGGYGGYGAAASSWDPYGRAAATGGTGYEMHNRRTSMGAGYGATDQYNQGYGQGYGQETYNTGYGQGYGQQTYQNAAPQDYALAQPQNNAGRAPVQAQMMMPEAQRHSYNTVGAFRQSPSFGQAHPGEQVEYGHAGYDDRYPPLPQQTQQQGRAGQADDYAPRPSEDAYGGYLPYEAGPSNQSQGHASNPPAYVAGPNNAGSTGDRKGSLGRQPSGRSGATRYSQDDDNDEEPRRVLKVANE